jgi:transcriptional regulator with XRE-family HTH domain
MTMQMSERKIAGDNIRALMEKNDLSVKQLTDELEIDRTYFHDILNGEANPSMEKYERIASRLGVTVRDLLEPSKRRRAS